MPDRKPLTTLKQEATNLGLTPYAGFYGDRRQRATWEKLLESAGVLVPLPERAIEKLPDRVQINWKLAIGILVGALALAFLLQPLRSKIFPLKITIQIGANK